MGIQKCVQCSKFIYDDEVVWVQVDDNHDAPYCVTCSPDDSTSEDYNNDY